MEKKLPVFTSETHGMAQRGGVVLSHLKVGDFASPLIRPFQADGLVVLKSENVARHGYFLKPGGWTVVNASAGEQIKISAAAIDADSLAQQVGNPRSLNLIILGFALAQAAQEADKRVSGKSGRLFCSYGDIKGVIKNRFGSQKKMLQASFDALEAGYTAGDK